MWFYGKYGDILIITVSTKTMENTLGCYWNYYYHGLIFASTFSADSIVYFI